MGNVEILMTTQTVVTAPAPVWLEAIGLSGFDVPGGPGPDEAYDPSFHDIIYIWTVRGSPLPNYSKPQNTLLAWDKVMVNVHDSNETYTRANVAYGKKVSFRLTESGIYDIDLWCIDSSGTTASATKQITVSAPSFSPSNTIVFAQDGDFTGAPVGTEVTTVSALQSAFQGRTAPQRISFKPGETIPSFRLHINGEDLAYVDTWVPGSKATLQLKYFTPYENPGFDYSYNNGTSTQITIRDLVFRGTWDPTTETGYAANGTFRFWCLLSQVYAMVYDCSFSGLGFVDVALPDITNNSSHMMMADCVVENWLDFGIGAFPNLNSRSVYAFLGNRITQNPQSMGGGVKEYIGNQHGCLRIQNAKHITFDCNDCFTTSGWSGTPPAANAALRFHTSVEPNSSTTCTRNIVEGGYLKIKIDGQNGGQTEYAGNHLFEKNVLIGTSRTFGFWNAAYGGTTFRNNLCYMPNVRVFDFPEWDSFTSVWMNIAPESPDSKNNQPFSIYSNSFISDETGGARWKKYFESPEYWTTFIDENNILFHLENRKDIQLDLRSKISSIKPRFSQVRFNYRMYLLELNANVPTGDSFSVPYSTFDRSVGFSHPVLQTGSTAATDQAYWQAAEAHGNNLHLLKVQSDYSGDVQSRVFHSEFGHFSVSYADKRNVVITNTSGQTWLIGKLVIRLDRRYWMDVEIPPASIYANPPTIPSCAPLQAAGPGETRGKLGYDDLFGNVRTQPISPGAIEA